MFLNLHKCQKWLKLFNRNYIYSSTYKEDFANYYQTQISLGFTKDFEVILKPSIGLRNIITLFEKYNFYHMCYLTFSQKSSGFRVSTEYRAYFIPNSNP